MARRDSEKIPHVCHSDPDLPARQRGSGGSGEESPLFDLLEGEIASPDCCRDRNDSMERVFRRLNFYIRHSEFPARTTRRSVGRGHSHLLLKIQKSKI